MSVRCRDLSCRSFLAGLLSGGLLLSLLLELILPTFSLDLSLPAALGKYKKRFLGDVDKTATSITRDDVQELRTISDDVRLNSKEDVDMFGTCGM